jgi:diadenosine tetraphosphate (Ap4A) HIT family hydrolase
MSGRWAWEPVARTEGSVAFLNRRQRSRGALLVAPWAHVESVVELGPEGTLDLLQLAQQVIDRLEARLHPDGVHLFWTYGRPAGQSEPHLHLQVNPRYAGVPYSFASALDLPTTPQAERRALARVLAEP